MITTGTLLTDLRDSLWRLLAGLFFGSAIGVLFGLLTGRIKSFAIALSPIIQILRPLPPVAIIPLVIVWFGIDDGAKQVGCAFGIINGGVRLRFFPDNIKDLAVSPDGKSLAYLLQTASGVDGYTAPLDSTGKKLFSLPLSQILLSWPAPGTLLLASQSSAGVAGIAFSADAKTGALSPLLYANGLTAIADSTFSRVVYQTAETSRATFVHTVKTGADIGLSFDPLPEKCAWSAATSTLLYCATPLSYTAPDYLDLWHQGAASAADALIAYDVALGKSQILTTPGGRGGGISSDVAALAVSPGDKYLLFIKKGDRSLWGVRLGN